MPESILVSIIVPVYNVEAYLDRCITSIVEQTYSRIEIIIINDGSTDKSLDIALTWSKKDSRVVLLNQENRGLGPSRTRGAAIAKGDYLAFVDSDDWLHPDFVKYMLKTAVRTNSRIVYCDVQKMWDYKSSVMRFPLLALEGIDILEHPKLLNQCGLWTWNKLYDSDLWRDLEQPANTAEDICTIFVLLVKAQRIAQVAEPLYFYTQRGDSLSYADSYPQSYINALAVAKKNVIKYDIDEKFWFYIGKIFGECLTFVKLYFSGRVELQEKINEMESRFKDLFQCGKRGDSLIFGSFNLRGMVKEGFYSMPEYFGFSSLIAALDPPKDETVPFHSNSFRYSALKKEFNGEFLNILLERADQIQYLFIDLLEERNGIVKLSSGGYATKSQAFCESSELTNYSETIPLDTEEFFDLWWKSCRKLKKLLNKNGFHGRIILVKNRLSSYYGEKENLRKFEDYEQIQKINQVIEKLENQFLYNFENAKVFDFLRSSQYYTDAAYVHGCFPWHLNVDFYSEAGEEFMRFMFSDKEKALKGGEDNG